jgi:hypothetical protein
MREQIWSTLVDLKFKNYCLMFLVDRFQKLDRNINIFLAIVSSGSIAAWAIWNKYPFIWGLIIASSQVLITIKPYFPYFKYVKELNIKCLKISNLNIEFERLWHKMQVNKLSPDQSEDLYFTYKKDINNILNFSDDMIFSVSTKIENKANEKMKIYLKNHYNVEVILTNKKR